MSLSYLHPEKATEVGAAAADETLDGISGTVVGATSPVVTAVESGVSMSTGDAEMLELGVGDELSTSTDHEVVNVATKDSGETTCELSMTAETVDSVDDAAEVCLASDEGETADDEVEPVEPT